MINKWGNKEQKSGKKGLRGIHPKKKPGSQTKGGLPNLIKQREVTIGKKRERKSRKREKSEKPKTNSRQNFRRSEKDIIYQNESENSAKREKDTWVTLHDEKKNNPCRGKKKQLLNKKKGGMDNETGKLTRETWLNHTASDNSMVQGGLGGRKKTNERYGHQLKKVGTVYT